jgi:hypothetical protein
VINAVGLIYYTYIDWSVEQLNHVSKKTVYCKAVEENPQHEDEEEVTQEDDNADVTVEI